ncbi:ABC transporter ATP binding protein [Metamycoplasma auris 15026]|uniref:ABC transporter ATP binding protein n=1 Tax=Metamycoplasma auris 15026 TaxID=1188233 RepID=N9TS96_9BACT|nr:ABC transporter ATP-binding protein [Metamycoplasma auris]ENY69029.1 ABC transporter ATP binding protein [Metamycoplasma auris 15026]
MFRLFKMMSAKFKILSVVTILLTSIQVIAFLFIPIFIGQISSLIFQKSFLGATEANKITVNINILKMFNVNGSISDAIKLFSIYFTIALLVGSFATLSGSILGSYVSIAAAKQIRMKLWSHLGQLSQKDIEFFTHSKILTRFTIDITRIQWGINLFLRLAIIGPFNLIFGLVFALLTDMQLSIILGVLIPVLMLTMLISGAIMVPYFIKEEKMYEQINNESQESILGIRVIKSYNLEKIQNRKFEEKNQNWHVISKKSWNFYNLAFAFVNLFANIATAIILLAAGFIIRKNVDPSLSPIKAVEEFKTILSNATTFINYVMYITIGVIMSSFVGFTLARSIISARKLNQIFNTKPDIDYIVSNKKITNGHICFDHVSFRYYTDSEKNVLEDITFQANPGETIGIIGPTGSGKSTIAQLLSLDFKTMHGYIKIDGHDIKEIDTKSLRSSISHIYQKPLLLSGTIKSNLLMANPIATEEQLIESIKNACAYDFVSKLDKNLDAQVQAKGVNFSGGQKQRLSIAQGLIKNPKILILDDSTSALDANTEKQIKKNIRNWNNGKLVTIIIAQKISSIMDADKIIVLEKGKMIDIGTHSELMQRCFLYSEIARTQLGDDNV